MLNNLYQIAIKNLQQDQYNMNYSFDNNKEPRTKTHSLAPIVQSYLREKILKECSSNEEER